MSKSAAREKSECTHYGMSYAGCPLCEISKLQVENQRLRDSLRFINDQLPINSALKLHVAKALEVAR